jgi:hypothetical protein
MQQQLIPFVAAAIKKEADSPRRSLTADQLVSVFNGLQNYDVDHSKGTLSLTHLSINFTGDKGKLNNSMDHTVYMQTGSQGPVHFVLAKSKKNLIEDRLKVSGLVASEQCFFEVFVKGSKDLKADSFGPEWNPKEKKGVRVGALNGDLVKITLDHPGDTHENFGEMHLKATWVPSVEDAIRTIATAMLHNKIKQVGDDGYRIVDWRDEAAKGRPGDLAIGVAKLRLNTAFDIFTSDPYLKIFRKTKLLYHCQTHENVAPFAWVEWQINEVLPNLRSSDKLTFVVQDKNKLMSDTFVGQIEVIVEDLWKGGATWFTVARDHTNEKDEAYLYIQADWFCEESSPQKWANASAKNITMDTQLSVAGLSMDEVTRKFKELDKDGNGLLDRGEFFEVYKQMDHMGLDPHLATKRLDDWLTHYGFDKKENISFDEFVMIMCHIQQF